MTPQPQQASPRPCPFCGRTDLEMEHNSYASWVRCDTCDCASPSFTGHGIKVVADADAIKWWNSRVPSTEITEVMMDAALSSRAKDDEGTFPPVWDLLGFSGINKSRTVMRAALEAAMKART